MIYINYSVYDLQDARNALFLNKNIDDYSCYFHFSVNFFIPVINTRCSKKQLNWLIFNRMNILLISNLKFWALFK